MFLSDFFFDSGSKTDWFEMLKIGGGIVFFREQGSRLLVLVALGIRLVCLLPRSSRLVASLPRALHACFSSEFFFDLPYQKWIWMFI